MPIATALAIAATAASVAGTTGGLIEGAQAGNRQQKALSIEEQIAQQEASDKQQAFKKLMDFFSPYLKEGSPFLSMIQRAAAETNATGANNAAGMVRNTVERSGLGFGPSGTEAAAIGGVGTEAARTGSQNYLQNLLNNEQVKFQAAQGINAAGSMAGSPQNQPSVSAQLPYQSLGSGLSGLSQVLQNLLKLPSSPGNTVGTLPTGGYPGGPPASPPLPIPGVPGTTSTSTPTVQGWNL
jgi:hypothetical protein